MGTRDERAQRLADLAMALSERMPRRRRPRRFEGLARPVSRRMHALGVRELVDAAAYDRGALVRAADLAAKAGDDVAEAMLRDAVAAITSR